MQPFTTFTGFVVPLDKSDIDTDQIIPKQFLKRIERTGFGQFAFFDWRYLSDGKTPNPDFVLNKPEYSEATILLVRKNFGCGSSREHAPWALQQYNGNLGGFRVIIASSFADIFYNNSMKNGLLPIRLSEKHIDMLFQLANEKHCSPLQITVDLKEQTITGSGISFTFDIDVHRRYALLNGLDDIGMTLQSEHKIMEYEHLHGIV